MDEETPVIADSPEFEACLKAIAKNGVYVQLLIPDEDGTKRIKNFNVKKGAVNHGVTNDNLIGFRPLNRREQRALFHTPYKYKRRM